MALTSLGASRSCRESAPHFPAASSSGLEEGHERGFMQWPERVSRLINYVTVDPSGLKRLPNSRHDMDVRGFTIKFAKELVQYHDGATKDLVMADWMAEWNMAKILAFGRRAVGTPIVVDAKLPPYLAANSTRSSSKRRFREVAARRSKATVQPKRLARRQSVGGVAGSACGDD